MALNVINHIHKIYSGSAEDRPKRADNKIGQVSELIQMNLNRNQYYCIVDIIGLVFNLNFIFRELYAD